MLEIGHLGQQWHVDEGNCRAFNQMNPDQHAHLFFFLVGNSIIWKALWCMWKFDSIWPIEGHN